MIISGCYYDVEEELYGTSDCQSQDMSYQADIFPLISNNCYQCHDSQNNFGNVTLEGYENLLKFVENGKLTGVINHRSGFSPMPKNNTKLLDCEIEKIESWIISGSPNN